MSFVLFPNLTNEADKLLIINRCGFLLRRVPFHSGPAAKLNTRAGMSLRIRRLEKLAPESRFKLGWGKMSKAKLEYHLESEA